MTVTVREQTVLPPQGPTDTLSELAKLLTPKEESKQAALVGPDGSHVEVPEPVYRVLRDVVTAMSKGLAITVAPHNTMLTTQEAADMLNMSRPTLVKLLERDKAIPFTQHGRHRRIKLEDVIAYQQRTRKERQEALDAMAADGEESGLYEATTDPIETR
ncbi:excisionase family DNA binding protein [Halopolyspora algeriensis]|uniref:Excisionase family DNA binding protein n=1 Tax=Halopolyspora algeriensis TaxID=1500506 RepID=A0A368VP70_9ACTN|nr:helix-turn-helix domain-containing protein [Halopolyspora algeriensis]RCW43294.1 excisionase family DNA binding protein [Halopolyspora algeriensis]TQM56353.1 excisionase family DNA binding protein [Halopolyspora algeriensis]